MLLSNLLPEICLPVIGTILLKVVFTDGHLKFGRPFTERPTRLTGYYKYTTARLIKMDKDSDKYDELYPLLKDKDDTCIIWVALGDWDAR